MIAIKDVGMVAGLLLRAVTRSYAKPDHDGKAL